MNISELKLGITNKITLPLLLLIVIFIYPPLLNAEEKKHVLVIHSYHKPFRWTNEIDTEIFRSLESSGLKYELYVEFMDTKHFSGDEYFNQLYDLYSSKYSNIKFDIIICSDNAAFDFLKKNRDGLFGVVPVVFCGVNNFKFSDLNGFDKITGVSEWIDFDSTLSIISKLQPEVKKIFVINEQTDTGISLNNDFMPLIKKYSNRFVFDYHDDYSLEDLLTAVSLLQKDTAVLYLAFYKDINGRVYEYDVIRKVSEASAVPVYCGLDFYLGYGSVGGVLVSGVSQGQRAADLALAILNGNDPSNLSVVLNAPNVLMFDNRQIERFSLNLDRINEKYIVINKEPGFYEEYKEIVLGTLALFFSMTIFILILVLNIIRRRKVEAELTESRNMLSWAHSLARIAHWSINLKTYDFIPSSEMNTMFGQSLDGCTLLQIVEKFVHEDDRDYVLKYIKRSDSYEEISPIEYRVRTSRGLRWFFSPPPHVIKRAMSGEKLILMGTIQDITDRHEFEEKLKEVNSELFHKNEEMQAIMEELEATNEEYEAQNEALLLIQRELVESEQKFRLIAETISDVIWIIDANERIQYISPPVEKMMHYSIPEIMQLPIDELFTELSVELLRKTFSDALTSNPLKTLSVQLEQKRKDQVSIWTETYVTPFVSDASPSAMFVCVTRDLTERFKTQEYMIQTEKMSTIAGLAAGMAHEINNPLSIIVNSADTLQMRSGEFYLKKRGGFSTEQIKIVIAGLTAIKFQEYVEHILSAGKRAAQIIMNMLAFSRKSQSVKISTNVNDLLNQTLELASKEYSVNADYDFNMIAIERRYSPVPDILCVPSEIEQVFLNIIKNAFQALSASADRLERKIVIETGLDNECVSVRIADNGPGIAQEYLKNIFDPFFTTKSGTGTGLGLSISYFIITQNHGGTIGVESDSNGAVFTVKLPVVRDYE